MSEFAINRDAEKIKDRNGREVRSGDLVSLDGNITSDDSMGVLPNGWEFDDSDIYQVYFDERIGHYSLMLDCEPDSPLNIKYMNHAVSLLHDGLITIVDKGV